MTRHDPRTCTDGCEASEVLAESRAEDIEPDYDESAAATSYERGAFGW